MTTIIWLTIRAGNTKNKTDIRHIKAAAFLRLISRAVINAVRLVWMYERKIIE